MVQVYFSAVMLLIRRTNATGGNVERGCFGVCLRYTARGGAGWRGAGRRGGVEGARAQGGGEGRDAMVYMGRGRGDDGEAGSGHVGSGRNAPTDRAGAGTGILDPPHRSPSHLLAGDHTFILWNTPSRNISRKSKRENALSVLCASNVLFSIHNGGLCIAGFTQGTFRAESSDHCVRINGRIHNIAVFVTKCSELSLLGDKPLSLPKPRLYITTLKLLCKSYALGRLFGGG